MSLSKHRGVAASDGEEGSLKHTFALVAAAAFLSIVQPVTAMAGTLARAMADDYIAVFDGGDSAAYTAFVHAHWPTFSPADDEFAGKMDRGRDQSGGYDRVKVVRTDATSVVEVVKWAICSLSPRRSIATFCSTRLTPSE